MRFTTQLGLAGTVLAFVLGVPGPADAGGWNFDGYGIYTPVEPPVRHRPRLHRYDSRSWYQKTPGYYPYYGTAYWVPRSDMRYRYRYVYYGPKYRYSPGWGYPLDR